MKWGKHVFRRPTICSSKQSLFVTAKSLYMFRVYPATIIRSTQTVVTTTGTGHEFADVMIKSNLKESIDEQLLHFGHEEIRTA